jgi:hypothetical protein
MLDRESRTGFPCLPDPAGGYPFFPVPPEKLCQTRRRGLATKMEE